MATVVLATDTRNAMADAVAALCNGGTLVFETDGDVEVATCTFNATAFGAAASGIATANAIVDDTNATGGVIEHVTFVTVGVADILEADVTATGLGGSFTGATVTIAATETVSISTLTITQPAS